MRGSFSLSVISRPQQTKKLCSGIITKKKVGIFFILKFYFNWNFICIVKNTKIAPRSLKKHWGRGKKLGSVGIPEHNCFLVA